MDREQPRQDYFPSCRARLILRFEDWGAGDAPAGPAKPPHLRTGTKDEAPLVAQRDGDRFILVPKGSGGPQQPGGPQGQLDSPDDRTHVVEGIVPLTCEVRRTGIREASEASISLALADFPFDPRAIRSCAVQIYMGTVSEEEARLGAEGATRGDVNAYASAASESISAVADTFLDPYGNQRSNLRFSGWVDDYDADFPEDDAPMINLECIDNTKLLADQDAPPQLAISADLPIDQAVASYLANFPQCEGLSVEVRPPGSARPALKTALANGTYKTTLGPPPNGKTTVLDYVADTVLALGFICWIEDTTLVIQKPRTLYAGAAGRPGDPFTGRRLPSGRVLERRTLIYGLNVVELGFGRKLGRKQAASVEVRCYSGRGKKTLIARHPAKGQRPTSTTPGGAAEEKWRVVNVGGIESEEALRAIAQAVYEVSNRHELTARVKTVALGSLGGGNEDPDLLDIEAGDALDIEVMRADFEEDSESGGPGWVAQTMTSGERARGYLTRIGYPEELAAAYAKAVDATAFPTTFRVSKWSLAWDASEEGGIEVSGELVNYVEARLDRELPQGEEPEVEVTGLNPVRVAVE